MPRSSRSLGRMVSMFQTSLGRLRVLGWLEGASFLLLLGVAMPLKYLAGEPGPVRVVGMAHGVLFIAYVLAAVHATMDYRWPWRIAGWLVVAAFLPAGPFIADVRVLRRAPLPPGVQ